MNKEFVTRLNNTGLDLFQHTPAQTTTLIRSDLEKFTRIINAAGIKQE